MSRCPPRPRRLFLGLATVLSLSAPAPVPAEDAWVRVRSPHFQVLSDAAPERARTVAVRLEQFRLVLTGILGRTPEATDPPTVVVAFRDQASFAPFLPLYRGRRQDVEGYFQAGSDSDYIAVRLGSTADEANETVGHEYAHVLLNRTLSAQPLWLAEGLAEVLSRWTLSGTKARVGLPAPDHLRRLQEEEAIPLARLLRVDYTSPVYNEGRERGMFYAQSWALAHWVLFGRGLSGPADLQVFLSGVASGADPERAFASAFGAEAAAAARLLTAYVAGPMPVSGFEAASLEAEVAVESQGVGRAEVEYRLGDLLLHAGRVAEARRHLERAVDSDPRFAPAHSALGHAALREGHWEEARREVGLALAAEPTDGVALYRYAHTIVRETSARGEVLSEAREAEVVAALEQALARAPQLGDACELLARLRPEPYDRRIAQVRLALARDPGRADLGLTLAGLYARKNDFTAARAVLRRTRALARDDVNRFLSDHLLAKVDRFTAGTAELKGTLVRLDCRADGVLRFVVKGAAEPIRLDTTSAGVFLYGREGGQVQRTFTCGPQHERVTAFYRPQPTRSADGADGILISLTLDEDR